MGFGKEMGRSIECGQDCHGDGGDGLQADFFDFLFSEQQVMCPALTIFEPLGCALTECRLNLFQARAMMRRALAPQAQLRLLKTCARRLEGEDEPSNSGSAATRAKSVMEVLGRKKHDWDTRAFGMRWCDGAVTECSLRAGLLRGAEPTLNVGLVEAAVSKEAMAAREDADLAAAKSSSQSLVRRDVCVPIQDVLTPVREHAITAGTLGFSISLASTLPSWADCCSRLSGVDEGFDGRPVKQLVEVEPTSGPVQSPDHLWCGAITRTKGVGGQDITYRSFVPIMTALPCQSGSTSFTRQQTAIGVPGEESVYWDSTDLFISVCGLKLPAQHGFFSFGRKVSGSAMGLDTYNSLVRPALCVLPCGWHGAGSFENWEDQGPTVCTNAVATDLNWFEELAVLKLLDMELLGEGPGMTRFSQQQLRSSVGKTFCVALFKQTLLSSLGRTLELVMVTDDDDVLPFLAAAAEIMVLCCQPTLSLINVRAPLQREISCTHATAKPVPPLLLLMVSGCVRASQFQSGVWKVWGPVNGLRPGMHSFAQAAAIKDPRLSGAQRNLGGIAHLPAEAQIRVRQGNSMAKRALGEGSLSPRAAHVSNSVRLADLGNSRSQ
eukprot:s652_g28.t1